MLTIVINNKQMLKFSCACFPEECVCIVFQAQLAQKTTLVNDSKLKEQEFREQVRNYFWEKRDKFSFSSKIHTHL